MADRLAERTVMPLKAHYRRILLKISGEALMGPKEFGLDQETVARIARDVQAVNRMGVEICLVIGGGNIFRGITGAMQGMQRAAADYMGMLATVMNALAMQNALEQLGVHTRVQSAITMTAVCEPYIRRRAMRHMEKGRVVIFHVPHRAPAHGKGPRGHLRRRHRQSLLHDRYRRRAARLRDGLRRPAQGHQGRWRLQRRSPENAGRAALRTADLSRSAVARPQGHGRGGRLAGARKSHPHSRILDST